MTLEDDIRTLLHAAAEDAPAAAGTTAQTVIGRFRTRRRTQRLAVAGMAPVAAAVLLFGGLPLLGDATTPGPGAPQPVADPHVDVLVGSPRGNLAGDEALLAGLLAADWTAPPVDGGAAYPTQPPDRSVVFAGDVGGIRIALVAATVDGQRLGAWFTGSRGAPAEQLRLAAAPAPLATDRPLTRLDTSTSPSALVVIAAPGDQVLLSDAVVVTAVGDLARTYQPLETVDGVATTTVDTTTASGIAASVRIDRTGHTVFRGAPAPTTLPGPAREPAPVRAPAGAAQPPPALVGQFAADLSRATGLDPATLRIRALWSGDLPAAEGGTVPAAVLAATYPSGAVAVAGGWTGATGEQVTWCTFTFAAAGTDPAAAPLAMRCTVPGAAAPTTSLVLLPPFDAAAVQRLDGDGAAIGRVEPMSGPAVVAAVGAEQQARFLDRDGRPLATVEVSPWFSGDLGRYGSGS